MIVCLLIEYLMIKIQNHNEINFSVDDRSGCSVQQKPLETD